MTATTQGQHRVCLDGDEHDGTIDTYELTSARRALELLKRRLGRERLLELLHEEIDTGNAFLRAQVERSAGRELTGTTTLRASGISAAQFGRWLGQAFGREDVLLAAHPEHWSIHHAPGRDVNIVETLGEYVCSFFMRPWDDSRIAAQGSAPGGGNARRSSIVLGDGTVVGSVSTGFEDAATQDAGDGLVARLSVTLPDTCAPLVEQHLEHFAVEFRSWILRAAAELSAQVDHAH